MADSATAASWTILAPPKERQSLDYAQGFDATETKLLRRGFVPSEMGDRWFAYFQDGWLYFHRSWTGALIYWLKLEQGISGTQVAESWVNRDTSQYNESDLAFDRKLLDYLVRSLLLDQDIAYPDRVNQMLLGELISLVPDELMLQSGAVAYTGVEAWSSDAELYLLGLNPGGDPIEMSSNTISGHTKEILAKENAWSEYADSRWGGTSSSNGRDAGSYGMQPRVLHLLRRIGCDPRSTPASNLIFVRTARESDLDAKQDLIDLCWPFHQNVISRLGIKVVVCFGRTVGAIARERLGATQQIAEFKEENNRGWKSTLHVNPEGLFVADLTHPSIADWSKAETDPSALVERALSASPE